ncbi:MAG TPA: helicase C-terminal domain-containing protein, partial [Lacipirellulaceae bacterium]|nr:helicase C-terminal domain-containing protein [Lacipirellulaceae bacterium]
MVSTHTISLQEQLIRSDLPLLNSVIPREFSAVLVKGRRNYVSLRRLQAAAVRGPSLFDQDDALGQLREIRQWSEHSADGSLADLPYAPLPQVWDEVASDHGNCMGRRCPTYAKCFYYADRRRAQHAQIMAVNHALFFSDLALRRQGASILPDYDVVVLDEAHTVEAVAADHLGIALTNGQVEFVLLRLYNDRTQKGLLAHHGLTALCRAVDQCRDAANEYFADLWDWRTQSAPTNGRVHAELPFANRLSAELVALARSIKQASGAIAQETDRQDFTAAHDRLLALAGEVSAWHSKQVTGAVYWVEARESRRGRPRLTLLAAPVDVGPALREQLFQTAKTVVMTSATLSTGREPSFEFFQSRLGVTQCDALRLDSPFDYRQQAELVAFPGMPDPGAEREQFERASIRAIQRLVRDSDGRAFVLMTSYDAMRRLASALAPWLTRHNLNLLAQSDGMPRSRMIEQFKANPRTVLLGVDSFWQGVDVPGDALELVIIAKLP